jgi:hypothetical protein
MKTKIITIIMMFAYSFCQSQTLYNIEDNTPVMFKTNYYLKDTNNLLNHFIGTWVYTNGNESITMVLKKKEHFQFTYGNEYEDLLYGGYRYVQNGVEIINTISQIDDPNITNFFEYSIHGNHFPSRSLFDTDPNVTGNVIKIYMSEPNGTSSALLMYKTIVNGTQALRVYKETLNSEGRQKGTPPPPDSVMPQGYLTFIKQ